MITSISLSPAERQRLRSQAHHLKAVILIGRQGLTPAVIQEIDQALTAHQLIKVKWTEGSRQDRDTALDQVCDTLQAMPVQHIGKQLVLWRPNPETHEATKTTVPIRITKKATHRPQRGTKKPGKPSRKPAKVKYWRH